MLVTSTNLYARTNNRLGNVTTYAMRCFIGILLLSGYNCVSRREISCSIGRAPLRRWIHDSILTTSPDEAIYSWKTDSLGLGYIEWFTPYQGSKAKLSEKYKALGLELKSRGLKGTGTIREYRLPKNCPIKSADKLRKEQRGSLDFASRVNNELTVCKWHDNNIVSISSNNMKVLPTTQIERFSRKEKKVIYVPQPNIMKKYNKIWVELTGLTKTSACIGYQYEVKNGTFLYCAISYIWRSKMPGVFIK
nr:unnamed protein product [Callosobruchus chinensis]